MDDGLAPDANGNAEGGLTMAEYIHREAALMKLMQDGCCTKKLQSISDMPAADVAPVVHGHWIEKEKYSFGIMYDCSLCDNRILDNGYSWNYCPNCGARMDETVEENKE